jgi:hypothetical protein
MVDVSFFNFRVVTRYALHGLTGMVEIKRSIDRLLQLSDNGLRDKFENHKLLPVSFTSKDVDSCVYAYQPFAPGSKVYNALVYEFGRSMVEYAFESFAMLYHMYVRNAV